MRDHGNNLFEEILNKIKAGKSETVNTKLLTSEFTSLLYFLIKRSYYAVIVDDYPFQITDKKSLLEALYYQVKLITVHDLNWDAIEEGLGDALNNFSEFEGIVLIFRNGENLQNSIPGELKLLSEIVASVNKQEGRKKIKILI